MRGNGIGATPPALVGGGRLDQAARAGRGARRVELARHRQQRAQRVDRPQRMPGDAVYGHHVTGLGVPLQDATPQRTEILQEIDPPPPLEADLAPTPGLIGAAMLTPASDEVRQGRRQAGRGGGAGIVRGSRLLPRHVEDG